MQELNEIRLINCIAEVTNKQIAMREDTYVYLDTKEDVEASVLAEAETLKATKEIEQEQADFRTERNKELALVDIEINKAEDDGEDTSALRVYRKALRDATIDWVMPESIL